ncbi:unnamed protein product [Linum trigynum]|uniref:Bet v I/Major latex protein domain-containing protein n=1 Tax=Linum trigynum TaxID=586398 RepID=A0AAV2FG85_9ROSI
MGVHVYTEENTFPVSPSRLFKALIGDSETLVPKLFPQLVKSISVVEGDGGVGTIRLITFQQCTVPTRVPSKNVKTRIDALDAEKFAYKYRLLEGDLLNEKIESISYEVVFVSGGAGETIRKTKTTYVIKGDEPPMEDERNKGKVTATAMLKVVEGYMQQNVKTHM